VTPGLPASAGSMRDGAVRAESGACKLMALFLVLASLLPAQDSRPSDARELLDRMAAAAGDSSAFGAAMLVEFALRQSEPAYTLAAQLWADNLAKAPAGPDAAETLRAIRDNRELPGPKRALAARMRRKLLARSGDVQGLAREAGADGQVRWFKAIGPFGFNAESFAGFAFGPESKIDFAAELPGFQDPVRWTDYAASPAAEQADPFEVLLPRTGAAYALAQIKTGNETLLVSLGSESSVELFVDGQRALAIDHRRELVPNRRWVAVAFPAGWHHLLVKTTDSGSGVFVLTVLDQQRGPVVLGPAGSAVEIETGGAFHAVEAPAAGTGPGGTFVVSDSRDVFKPAGERAADLVAACLLGWRGLPEEAFVAARGHLDAADLSVGEIGVAHLIVDQTTHLPDTDKKARLLDLARRALAKDPSSAMAQAALARNEATNDRVEEGIGMLQKALAGSPKSVDLWEAQLDVLEGVGFESDREKTLAAALAACPNAPKLWERRLTQLEKKKAFPAWIDESRRFLASDATELGLAHALGARLLSGRRFDDLEAFLETQAALHPHEVSFEVLAADAAHEQGDRDRELAILAGITSKHPKETSVIERMASRILADKPDDERVPALLRTALKADPDLHDVRRLLNDLRPPAHDYFKEFLVDTKSFLEKAPGADAYPDSRIVLLLDQITLWIHEDGSAEQETHQIHRLQDPRGKEDLGTVSADGDVKVVRTILPDGKSLVPNQLGRGSFEMAGLEPGVVVERRYRRFVDRFVGRPESFGGFYFQDTRLTQPFHYTRYVVIVPKKLGLVPVVERFEAKYKREERGDDLVFEFLLEKMPRIQREAMMPRAEDLVPHVEFRRPDTWDKINRRYLDAYETAWRPTPTLREAAAKAVGDATDPVERARKLYEFVMDTVTSTDGMGLPTQTLLEKSGDRFPLYLALLKAADVPHSLAMGRNQEKVSPPVDWKMVSDDLFDVPLARIEPPGKDPVYVSTQLRWIPFGQLRYDQTDAQVFVTAPGGGRIERIAALPLAEAKSAMTEMDLALDAAGLATGTVRLTLYGWAGAFLKEQIERTDKKRLDQWANGAVLGPIGRLAPKPKGPVRFKNATSRTAPLVIEVDVEMKQLVRKTDGGGTLEVPFRPMTLAKGFVDRKERKLPFVFHQYFVEDAEATITLDPSWKLDEAPKDFERKGPLGSFTLRRKLDGSKLTLRREIALTPADIPASGFPDVASFAKDIDQAEAQKIQLRREVQ
jgi:tetratricopeptide (TPR) repeat protein